MYKENDLRSQHNYHICCLAAFARFMRSLKLLNIKVCDILFYEAYMAIFIESSKTNKYREGSWIAIDWTGTCLCPVENVEKLLWWAKMKESDFFIL